MSSATFMPSASSDSGSSSSLTPTANTMHNYEPVSSSAGPSASLFSSEENKFITDSLSSAESFDPFTIGAPGFKVPSLLPPNITSPPLQLGTTHLSSNTDSSVEHGGSSMLGATSSLSLAGPSSGLDLRAIADQMRSRRASGHPVSAAAPSNNSPQQQQQAHADPFGNPAATHRFNNWNLYGYRGGPPASFSPQPADGTPNNWSRHASFSGAPSSPFVATTAGYGKNRVWQMEQLSFLEAQANRGSQHQHMPHSHEHRRSSTSVLLSPSGSSDSYYSQQHHQQHVAPYYNNGDDGNGGLATLGSQFPSSHSFPSAIHENMHGVNPSSFNTMSMMSGNAGLEKASSQGPQTPRASKSRTPTGNLAASIDNRGPSPTGRGAGVMSASLSSAPPLKRSCPGSTKPISSAESGPSSALSHALATLAPLDLDLESAMRILPAYLHQYYLPHRTEKKYQPHLEMLRRQHIQDGLMDDAGREIKKLSTQQQEEEEEEKEKKAHTLLTTEEKKANHIASEQKRRANIRKGYELLCDIVPALREALEREAKRGKHGEGSSDDNDNSSGAEDKTNGKKGVGSKNKKNGSAASKKVRTDDEAVAAAACGIEVDGEKIDGRAGPRSEAVVLMKSLEHISMLLETFRALLGRRNRARLAVARSKGWDGLVNNQSVTDDIESMLAAKMEEWFSTHAEDDDDEDEDEDEDDEDEEEDGDDDDDEEDTNADDKNDMQD